MASIVSAGTTSSTALNMSADTSGVLQLASNNGTTAVTIDTSQNVGIGTASPSTYGKLAVVGGNIVAYNSSSSASSSLISQNDGNVTGSFVVRQSGYATYGAISANNTNIYTGGSDIAITADGAYNIKFGTGSGATERMRIDPTGALLVGTTTAYNVNDNGFNMSAGGGTALATKHISGTTSGAYYALYMYNGSIIGSITQNGTTGVLYNLTSDYRLKNNPVALTGAKDFVMALQPKTWDWWDGSGKGVGFIAHEFMEVAKYSGNGEKDAVDADGKPVYQSIQPSSSEVMANIVALLQEQQALITQLQADVTALKTKVGA